MVIKPERYHEFGIALHVDKELETGYFLRMNPKNQLVAWDMSQEENREDISGR